MRAQNLIVAGIVIQLAVFGLGQLGRVSLWAISQLAGGAWTLFTALANISVSSPPVHAAELWPLILVAAGLTALAASKHTAKAVVPGTRSKRGGSDE